MGSKQSQPLASQKGKTFVVTGANSGLGYVVAKELAKAGGHVVVCARSHTKSSTACAAIRKELGGSRGCGTGCGGGEAATTTAKEKGQKEEEGKEQENAPLVFDAGTNGGKVEVGVVDLANLSSVKEFASSVSRGSSANCGGSSIVGGGSSSSPLRPIHCLVNNAGVMDNPTRELSTDGFEMQLATNCLGHYALTVLLVPALRQSMVASAVISTTTFTVEKEGEGGQNGQKEEQASSTTKTSSALAALCRPRVVNVSSFKAAQYQPPQDPNLPVDFRKDPDPVTGTPTYNPDTVYCESKLVNLMINNELARRCPDLVAVGCHPGACSTNLFKHKFTVAKHAFQSPEKGADSILLAAIAADALPGNDWCGIGSGTVAGSTGVVSGQTYYGPLGMYGGPTELQMPSPALDPAQLSRYWTALEKATGIVLPVVDDQAQQQQQRAFRDEIKSVVMDT